MNFKTTIVLLVIVAGLAGWVWYDSRTTPTVPTASMPKRVFKQFSPDDATRIAIARGAGLKDQLVLVKTVVPPAKGETNETKVWKLEKPVADAADDVNVGRILEKVQLLEADQKLEGEQAKKALFGASPVLTLTVSRP